MTIKEYCRDFKDCNSCLLNGLCKGTDKDKFRPENYSYSEDIWVTHQLLQLLEIIKEAR